MMINNSNSTRSIRLKCLQGLAAFGLLLFASSAVAQLPELTAPSSLTGTPTSARFFAGASADNGVSYGFSFAFDQPIDVMTEIQVEPGHINSTGNLYVLIAMGEQVFMQVESGAYELWDSTLENLQAASPDKTLQASEAITIVDDVAFGPAGVFNASLSLYLAYDTVAAPNELYFSGVPLTFFIADDDSEAASFTLYKDTISTPIVQNRCIVCHKAGGIAGISALLYVDANTPDYQSINYNTLMNYLQTVPNAASLILTKPQGQTHGGGVQLAAGSADFDLWSQFVTSALTDIAGGGGSGGNIFAAIIRMDNEETLRKAALLFAGRLPTEAELASVSGADDEELRSGIRALMSEFGFSDFLIESANDRLLTEAFTFNLFAIVDRDRYPNSLQYYQNPDTRTTRLLASAALAQEPEQLIAHVVTNERPYTEILTADYIMVNPYSAEIYGGNVVFDDYNDFDEWREGRITEYYRCTICGSNNPNKSFNIPTVYPHAGILNSPAFLSRFESTETNRNRARARWAYYFFLGVDIEALAERTTDPDALADENNPTLNNENCVVCHTIMDPVAGSFQNYGDDGYFRDQPGGLNSLPGSYRNDPFSGFQIGDTWYSDMLAPGFGELLAPDPDNSLQWLAQEFVQDSRFGFGTVHFWYPSVIGRDPYAQPENPEDLDYLSRLAAYTAEQALMQQLAADFVAGIAGNGAHNLKDMLVDLAMSDHFRAGSVTEMDPVQEVELQGIGNGKLLTPEQLNRKLIDVTGYSWDYGTVSALDFAYSLIYGGIDSFGITERATELTTLMSTVVTAMANETSCAIASLDFSKDQADRKLFTEVEMSTLPTTNPTAIRNNIQKLHMNLWGEDLSINDPEIDATYDLFVAIWQARVAAGKGAAVSSTTELCLLENVPNPIQSDPNQTLRSWTAVVNYMLRDYKFIYE